MALRLSTGMRTAMAGTNGGIQELLNNGWLEIYTGAQPLSADAVETGQMICKVSSTQGTAVGDGCKFGTAASGTVPLTTPKWEGVVVVDAQVAGWFRFYGSNGTGGSHGTSSAAIRLDGNCGVSGSDLVLKHTNLSIDSILTIKKFSFTQPAE